jgi:hypothetical protein
MRLHDMSLVREWHHGLRVAHKAHIQSAAHADNINRFLGIPSTIITAIVGTAIFASLAKDYAEIWQLKVLFGFFSIVATVLTALQTHLNFSEQAELHRKAAGSYGKLRRQLEELLATYSDANPCEEEHLKAVGKAWADVEASAPSLSQSLYKKLDIEASQLEKKDG